MGTGKTTVGRRLARDMGLKFIDLDEEIEQGAAARISAIFREHGEVHFRTLEGEAVTRLVSGVYGGDVVAATGGGAVVSDSNRAALRSWGVVVRLAASADEIRNRVGGGAARPLLSDGKTQEDMEKLLASREDAYRDCDLSVDTTGRSVAEVVADIKEFLRKKAARTS
ncbi:MAG: shikimate kinase [Deltaproteobacteria bacterium]|nr:shikimate kinase [Deltaproteobacteria bacterium]